MDVAWSLEMKAIADMGFPHFEARRALAQTQGDLNDAIELLFERQQKGHEDGPAARDDPFHEPGPAARWPDGSLVRTVSGNGARPSADDLCAAVAVGDPRAVRELLRRGAPVSEAAAAGVSTPLLHIVLEQPTPLHHALVCVWARAVMSSRPLPARALALHRESLWMTADDLHAIENERTSTSVV
jgi:hypothetical protein